MERPEPDVLTFAEVAERLGESYRQVRDWADRGLLPVTTRDAGNGRRWRWVRWANVRAFGELHYLGKDRPAWLDEPEA